MKRLLVLLTLVFSLALAGSLPNDARFNQPVSNLGDKLPLAVLLEALAKSVGLSPVLRDVPNVVVSADFDKKPFRQVWDLLVNTYGDGKLDYALLPNNVIVVGTLETVQRALGPKPTVAPTPGEPTSREFYEVRAADPAQLATFLEAEITGLTVRTTPGQSVIVITGTAKQQSEAATLLQRVDRPKPPAVPTLQKSFSLSHGRATELAEVFGKALNARATPATGAAGQGASPTVSATVVADARTNTVIITGSAEQISLAERLLPQLDRPIQQVQLQIRVQSVSGEVSRNLGVKWEALSVGPLVASVLDTAASGLKLIFDATRSLSSLNIRAVLDALEQQRLSRRLSDANVLVEDNYGADLGDLRASGAKGAEIKSGGKLLVTLPGKDEVREFDYGLLVRVRPQIATDGNILLEVFTQIGSDPGPGPGDSIRIPQQTTLSKLRVRDGQTLVLGGLIEKVTTETQTKVPFLGDIPLLGELFKQRTNGTQDDELIVIITANIVKDVANR
jgi:type IV pilus assembly protein PilQ